MLILRLLAGVVLITALSAQICTKTAPKRISKMDPTGVIKWTAVDKTVHFCCEGYKWVRNKCVPKCSISCKNASRSAAYTSSCLNGYTNLNGSRCIPHCDGCKHGICISPGQCSCPPGYRLDKDNDCAPISTMNVSTAAA